MRESPSTSTGRNLRRRGMRLWGVLGDYVFLALAAVFAVLFLLYPLAYNINVSLRNFSISSLLGKGAPFVGLANFQQILSDAVFWMALRNTVVFTVGSIAFQFVIGLLIALYFQKKFALNAFFRAFLILPWLIPIISSANVFRWLLNVNGPLNFVLIDLGLGSKPIGWLTDPHFAIWAVTIANIWIGIPFNFVLLYTGLQGIPAEQYEAARIDGANGWQATLYITLPWLRPVIGTVLLLGTIYTSKVFDVVWIMTKGGPANSSQVLATYAYQWSFELYHFGPGSAAAAIMFVLIGTVTILYLRFARPGREM